MGVLWTTYPLNDEMTEWLDSLEVSYPKTPSRFPTGREVKDAVSELNGIKASIRDNGVGGSWQVWLESETKPEEFWTLLNITNYSGDNEQQEIWFEKGHEHLIKQVLAVICAKCGPLVLIPDTGGDPEVVSA